MDNKLKDKWAEPEAIEAIIEWHAKKLISMLCAYNNHLRLCHGSVPHPTTSTKAVTGHVPPTTTNAQEHVPPPPSSCQHSHAPSVAPKRVARVSQLVHATTPGLPQQRTATPNAKEGTDTTQCHIASRPQGPRVALMRVTAARHKRRHTTQCRCSGTKVCCLPLHLRGTHPPLANSLQPGKTPRRTEACNTDTMERPGRDPPKATTAHHDNGSGNWTAPRAPPHTTVHQVERPWHCAEACETEDVERPGCDPPTATTTGRHDDDDDWGPPVTPIPLLCPPGRKAQALCARARHQSPHSPCSRATTHQ